MFAALAAAVVVGALLCTVLGSVSIAPGKIAEILLGGGSDAERNILTQIRLPRMCMTVLLGGALAVSGYLLQTCCRPFSEILSRGLTCWASRRAPNWPSARRSCSSLEVRDSLPDF